MMDETIPAEELEARIEKIGNGLFAAMNEKSRSGSISTIFGGRALQRRVFAHAGEDAHFRTQLFRFIDVYPNLRDSGDLVRHLRAYLSDRSELPEPLARVIGTNGRRQIPSWAVARLTERTMQRIAKTFILGREAGEIFPELKRLRKQHTAFTLDILDQTCLSETEAADYARRYLDVLELLPPKVKRWSEDPVLDQTPWGENPRMNISVKISSLYSQIDPADFEGSRTAVVAALRPIVMKAREQGAFVNIDLELFALRDLTYAVFSDLARDPELADYPHLGVVVQAYLKDGENDLLGLIALAKERGTPITVRLVKGAYWDYETIDARQQHRPLPVFSHKAETDAQFERLAKIMIDNHEWTRPALGTHNVRSIAAALAMSEAAGLPPRAVELQMLHGMADPVRRAAVAQRYLVREYVPVGDLIPGMAYLVRRLLENTSNDSFVRLAFSKTLDGEALLRPPQMPEPQTTPEPSPETKPADPGMFQNEPHADLSRSENRQAMEKALATIGGSLGRRYGLLIDGQNVETETSTTSFNPASPDEIVGVVASASTEHADAALEAAQAALPAWRDTPVAERAAALLRAAAIMRGRRYELAALEVIEAGKPWREADADVTEAIDFLEYYGRDILRLCRVRDLSDVPGEEDLYFYEPRGVAAIITPWNFPLAIPAGMVAAALVTGNTVVFKPAEPTPVLGYALVRILHEAGFPGGAVNFLPGPGESVGEHLVGDPRVDLIAFTGSMDVGLSIMQKAAVVAPGQRNIKRVVAEMGGKNAIIVDTDADLDAAVEGVVKSAFGYTGQKCSACSRVVVLESIHDQFVRRLVQATADLKIGDPADPGTKIGPVISEEARGRILAYIEKGKNEARLVFPPQQPEPTEAPQDETVAATAAAPAATAPGYYVAPHIFLDTPPDAVIAQEEIFGPVLVIQKARKFKEALELAQGVQFGLTGGVYSRNPDHIRRSVREYRVGNLYINRPITGAMVGRQPFGGSRMSGVGSKAGGPDYLLQFMEPRTVTENTIRRGFTPED
jgi:RHH-type transcriptional regulator, proline utilization regulon repressor / proline dehydrogenase / delta 1-pyrroline-5-carboxylate dehydrogenase